MFKDVIGDWPTNERFILTSCDDKYFDRYFPRFYNSYRKHCQLPIHVHVIDPSDISLQRLEDLKVTYTYYTTDPAILKWRYSYETYCQAQRFILLGYNLLENQSRTLESDMAFTEYNGRLMATFCNFHHGRRALARESAIKMQKLIQQSDTIGVDQLVIKETFKSLPYNKLKHQEWIRHFDNRTDIDAKKHNQCLIYHEKGKRGKIKTVETAWTDIR